LGKEGGEEKEGGEKTSDDTPGENTSTPDKAFRKKEKGVPLNVFS